MITAPEKTIESLQTAVTIVRVSQARLEQDGLQALAKILASVLDDLVFCVEDLIKRFPADRESE